MGPHEYIEQRRIEIDRSLPAYVYDLKAFRTESMPDYDVVPLRDFVVEHVDLEDFCFVLKARLGRSYGFEALKGEVKDKKCIALLDEAEQNDELGEVVFELANYWIGIENSPRVFKASGIHQNLASFYANCSNATSTIASIRCWIFLVVFS